MGIDLRELQKVLVLCPINIVRRPENLAYWAKLKLKASSLHPAVSKSSFF
jgi:hypothetical protein